MTLNDINVDFLADLETFQNKRQAQADTKTAEQVEEIQEARNSRLKVWGVSERKQVRAEIHEKRVRADMAQPDKGYRKFKGVAGQRRMDGADENGQCIVWSKAKIREVYGI